MRHYCTLFDSKYLAQGLVLYESLKKHSSEEFTLWVLPMDDECDEVLRNMRPPLMKLVNRNSFEAVQGLRGLKESRTWAEYCWTCASNLVRYLINPMPDLTYLDSDCWFADNPQIVFDEIGNRSIGIIPHRFTHNKEKVRLSKAGRFNVSLVYFKNNDVGRTCLSKWATQCRERCDAESYGDQLFLEGWPGDYGNQCAIIDNIAVGVAPWNLESYKVTEGPCVDGRQICMFHFHEYRNNEDGTVRLTNYPLREEDRLFIYGPYIEANYAAMERIGSIRGDISNAGSYREYPIPRPTPSDKESVPREL